MSHASTGKSPPYFDGWTTGIFTGQLGRDPLYFENTVDFRRYSGFPKNTADFGPAKRASIKD